MSKALCVEAGQQPEVPLVSEAVHRVLQLLLQVVLLALLIHSLLTCKVGRAPLNPALVQWSPRCVPVTLQPALTQAVLCSGTEQAGTFTGGTPGLTGRFILAGT